MGVKMLNQSQKNDVEELIRHVGDECIFNYFKRITDSDISYKESNMDPVTIADREAEKLLQEGLLKILPESLFIGEELYAIDQNIISFLDQGKKPVWVVDPIDGTDNFINGQSGFGVMVCLVFQGDIVASWLYEVTLKRMTSYYAPQSLYENGLEIIQKRDVNGPLRGLIGKKLHRFPVVQKLKEECREIILEPAQEPSLICYHQMLVGSIDFLVFKVTYPWDHLAGIALLKPSGAVTLRWSGEPFLISDIDKGLVVARNSDVMNLVLEKIAGPLLQSEDIAEMKSFKE